MIIVLVPRTFIRLQLLGHQRRREEMLRKLRRKAPGMEKLPFDLEKPIRPEQPREEFGPELARIITVTIRELLRDLNPHARERLY